MVSTTQDCNFPKAKSCYAAIIIRMPNVFQIIKLKKGVVILAAQKFPYSIFNSVNFSHVSL